MWLFRRKFGKTAKKLAVLCHCRASKRYLPRRRNFIINYGQRCEYANLNRNVIFDKLAVSLMLNEAKISIPRIFLKGEAIPDEVFPLLARKRYHSQGRDIIYIHDREQLDNDLEDYMYDFLVEYVNKTSEYRVHFLRDYDTLVSVKFNPNGDGDPIVRSHQNKWNQINYDREWKDALIELAKKTMDVLGYDFGAIDIIRKGQKLYVLEINTAPGLEDRKLNIYAQYFRTMERKWLNSR